MVTCFQGTNFHGLDILLTNNTSCKTFYVSRGLLPVLTLLDYAEIHPKDIPISTVD